ncbi:hypothetical protein QYE76_005291 [Lolium multiflorum]|uniref:CCHC-type domain-containing protein n=1 Tax=Lolium multiflorum TaxID=4521 RepID=A0AAD8W395_LOLMU|nr:hypothetical protein QYE76_005291 [Lolium multiflorum]
MLCHTCGGKGHFKRDCPNRKVMFINEDNEYETGDDVDPNAPDDDDYDTDGEDAYPSNARTIVVSQRALNVLPSASTRAAICSKPKLWLVLTRLARVNMEASKRADFVRKIHEKTKELIEKKGKSNAARMNKKRKEMLFKPGDLVWTLERRGRRLLKGDDEDIPTSLLPPSLANEDEPAVKLKSNEVRIGPITRARAKLLKQQYQEETCIARGEEQLDVKTDIKKAVKLDMELDMKISHGRAREEREECARGEEEVQAGPEPGRPATRPAARSRPRGPSNRPPTEEIYRTGARPETSQFSRFPTGRPDPDRTARSTAG